MSGYDKFFKEAKTVRHGEPAPKPQPKFKVKTPGQAQASANPKSKSEDELRKMFKMAPEKKRRKKTPASTPWMSMALSFVALAFSAYYLIEPEFFENLLDKVEISATAMASAAEGSAKSSAAKDVTQAKTSPEVKSGEVAENKTEVPEDTSYFSKLTERNKQLDAREKELNELEEELHRQRAEVEVQIKRLEDMRRQIASVLNERVEIDEEKVNKLVEVYSNMKPKQAADIIATLNEDLAVEVLGRMKKKDAAGILNLIEAKKAQTLSEKYTGYKTR